MKDKFTSVETRSEVIIGTIWGAICAGHAFTTVTLCVEKTPELEPEREARSCCVGGEATELEAWVHGGWTQHLSLAYAVLLNDLIESEGLEKGKRIVGIELSAFVRKYLKPGPCFPCCRGDSKRPISLRGHGAAACFHSFMEWNLVENGLSLCYFSR